MRIKITLKRKEGLTVPRNYQQDLQEFILMPIKDKLKSLDDFKEINFSLIKGDFNANKDKTITYMGDFSFYLSSTNEEFLNEFEEYYKKNPFIIRNQECQMIEMEKQEYMIRKQLYILKTISPVTVYENTLGKTVFYSPDQLEFSKIINHHLHQKYRIQGEDDLVEISAVKNIKKIVMRYKGKVVESYQFECKITSSPQMLRLIYNDGIGNRTNQGFGMVLFGF